MVVHSGEKGFSAIIYQSTGRENAEIIGCCGRTYKPAENNYSEVEKQLLAIYHCLKKYAYLLHGHKIIVSTSLPMATILKFDPQWPNRLMKWDMLFGGFDINWEKLKNED